jgi:acetyl esterase/lipase
MSLLKYIFGLMSIILITAPSAAVEPAPEVIQLWSGPPPGTESWTGEETIQTLKLPGGDVRILGNVTKPTLTVFRPKPETGNGTAVIVIPGGGFVSLAIDHEGYQVAEWLTQRGVTAIVLKYRVHPNPNFRIPAELRKHPERFQEFKASFGDGIPIAVADATQALRYLRDNASYFGIDPNRVGMIGFSAGAITTMGVVMNKNPEDRPNFGAPIYGAMDLKDPPKDAPPLFIAVTQDDPAVPATESIAIFNRWNAALIPAELHVYEKGGHGFGMMTKKLPVDNWTAAYEAWLSSHGWLTPPKVKP